MGHSRIIYHAVAFTALAGLTGCVSTQMKKLVGMPVQEAAVQYGNPFNVIDMPDGRRVFQFQSSRKAYMPAQANTTGSVWGNSWDSQTTVTGGHPISIDCTYTFYSAWNDKQKAWIVTDYKTPKKLIC